VPTVVATVVPSTTSPVEAYSINTEIILPNGVLTKFIIQSSVATTIELKVTNILS
jgi:hypothetical protein